MRTWGDEKFRALSPIQPSGQALWLFLITGPHTGPIPGLFRAGRAAMSEELDWEVEAFDKAFAEVFAQGMVKADFKARVMWVPNAIKHNKPESPNVVRSWAAEFDLIPECVLKLEAFNALKGSIHALGEAYAKAFDETLGKASAKPFGKPSAKTMPNQEQEQEQEQKQERVTPGKSAAVDNSQPKASATRLSLDFEFPETWSQWARTARPDILDMMPVFLKFRKLHANAKVKTHDSWLTTFRSFILNERVQKPAIDPMDPLADPDSRASIEAKGVLLGIGKWDPLKEQWPSYKARVLAKSHPITDRNGPGMGLDALERMAHERKAA